MNENYRFIAEQIKAAKQNSPSLKVVGRGTVMINPIEIVNSASFKADASRVGNLKIK